VGVVGIDLTLGVALVFGLVLFVAAVALCMVRLGLASAATVLALLDGATLGVDVVQLAVCVTGLGGVAFGVAGGEVPLWVQPLTRWPFMQDEQAHFSPSMTGIPGRRRPGAVVATG
jgi:hypothetical protein